MTEREFRFGVVAGRAPSGADWAAIARRAEALGYDTLLVPDTRNTLAPFPALAAAAAATTTLHVGTYVLSVPNRSPGLVAWEAESLQLLSDGRFELGLGGGRPGAERDAAAVGADFGTPGDRLQRVAEIIDAVGELDHPPRILIAAGKPRMLRLAADPASLPAYLSRMVGGDPRVMAESGAISMLTGSPGRIADLLCRRREEFGVSYLAVNGQFIEQFAEVIAILKEIAVSTPSGRTRGRAASCAARSAGRRAAT